MGAVFSPIVHPFSKPFHRTIPKSVAGGGASGPSWSLTSNGSLFIPAMDSLADWTTAEAPWSAVAVDGFVCTGGIDRTYGDARYPLGRRNPIALVDGGTLYQTANDYPGSTSYNYIQKSTDMGRSWTYLGKMSELSMKIGGGTWIGGAGSGWIEKRGSTYYYLRVTTDTPGGFPPYGWDVWSATDLDVPDGANFGDWEPIRTQSAGTDWAGTDLLPGSTVLFEGTYYHFAQAYPGGWVIGIMSASSPEGPFTQLGATALFGASDFPDSRNPENPRVFFHPGIGKYVMLVNLIAPSGTYTDSNAVIIGTDDPTDWTGAAVYVSQFVAANHGTNNIGMLNHFAEAENELIYDATSNDLPIVYDTDATGDSPGWHVGRRVIAAVLKYGDGEYQITAGESKKLTKTLAHTAISGEMFVRTSSATGNSLGFVLRVSGSGGYICVLRDNNTMLIFDRADSSLLATGTGTAPSSFGWSHIKVVADGANIKCYVNGELQINYTDGTNRYPSGTEVWLATYGLPISVRNVKFTTGPSVTFTGLQERQVITLRGPGNVCLDEVVADEDGEASYTGNFTGIQSGLGSITALTAIEGSAVELTNAVTLPTIAAVSAVGDHEGTTLNVTATGVTTYRWQILDGSVWRNIQGLDAASEVYADTFGTFRCLLSNSVGCIATEEVTSSLGDSAFLYLDSDRGIFTERTGASATTIAEEDDRVGTWRDTISGHNFVASSDAARPTLRNELIDSFESTPGAYLEDAAFSGLANKSEFTIIVESTKDGGSAQAIIHRAGVFSLQWFANELLFLIGTGTAKFANTDTALRTLTIVFDGRLSGNANRLKVYQDGVQQTLTFTADIPVATSNTSGLVLFDLVEGGAPWVGGVKKIVAYSITMDEAPENTVAPAITGSTQVDDVLSVSNGTWTGATPITYTYQWLRDAVAITGATNDDYTLVEDDVGADITCAVTATNAIGNDSATSAAVGPVTAYIPLLDTYTGATAAYSLRKMRTAYAGSAIRVRRSSDDTEQDIGFVDDYLDTATMLTFCGAGNGFIVTWYDQSGNGYNATQATTTAQPKIVASGVLDTEGSLACARFDGGDWLETASGFGTAASLSGNAAFSMYAVVRRTGADGSFYGWGNVGVALNCAGQYDSAGTSVFAFGGGNSFITSATPTTRVIHSQLKTAGAINTTASAYRNGVSVDAGGHSSGTPNIDGSQSFRLGDLANLGSTRLIGAMQEFILYPSGATSRAAVEAHINAYWGVY